MQWIGCLLCVCSDLGLLHVCYSMRMIKIFSSDLLIMRRLARTSEDPSRDSTFLYPRFPALSADLITCSQFSCDCRVPSSVIDSCGPSALSDFVRLWESFTVLECSCLRCVVVLHFEHRLLPEGVMHV